MNLQIQPVPPGSELEQAAAEFLAAGAKYREFLKRHARERLAGTIWVRGDGGELVLYSEHPTHPGLITDAIRAEED